VRDIKISGDKTLYFGVVTEYPGGAEENNRKPPGKELNPGASEYKQYRQRSIQTPNY
jgi:hypothetical protein